MKARPRKVGPNLRRRPTQTRKKVRPPPTRGDTAHQELINAVGHVVQARTQVEKACAHLSGLVMPANGAALLDKLREVERVLKDARYSIINLSGKCESDTHYAEWRGKHDACGGGK